MKEFKKIICDNSIVFTIIRKLFEPCGLKICRLKFRESTN